LAHTSNRFFGVYKYVQLHLLGTGTGIAAEAGFPQRPVAFLTADLDCSLMKVN
jgi:hypothetical protein